MRILDLFFCSIKYPNDSSKCNNIVYDFILIDCFHN